MTVELWIPKCESQKDVLDGLVEFSFSKCESQKNGFE